MRKLLVLVIGILIAQFASAQPFPSKPVRLVVPFAAGGATDILGRMLATPLGEALGTQVIVDNKPGAEGAIGGDFVAKSPPDGYTLFMGGNTSMLGVPLLRKTPPYNSLTDFTSITQIIRYVFILCVHPDVPAKTLSELVAHARANPGKLNFGSGNVNAVLAATQMGTTANLKLVHVPYKGEAAAMPDLLSGRLQFMFVTATVASSAIKEGKLRPLAIMLPERSSIYPDLPTVAEAGMPQLSIVVWTGIFGPAKMPKDVVDRLARDFNTVLKRPDVRDALYKQSLEPAPSSPEALSAYLRSQLVDWTKAAKEAGLQPSD